ncbi:MAG: tetratricopeptide repeat protein [Candidatus Eremiobacteraeota bacterium]|nr:tetratricopeptide repeat protein [Candidatus Eremiobacteraeota bacterium]
MAGERKALERALNDVQSRLRNHPGSLDLLFERARLLDRLGRTDEARVGYVDVLQRDAHHFGALNDLGMLLFKAGLRQDAFTCFNAAVAKHPRNAIGHANLALVLLRGGEAAKAREHYQTALSIDPRNTEAHRGLALALAALGEHTEAESHRDAGFGTQPIVGLPYRGEGEPVRVLSIVSAGPGNVPWDRFIDDRIFAVWKAVAEYCTNATVLPEHDFVLNTVGDADVAAVALERAAEIADRSGAPVLNSPTRVAATGRVENASRMRDVEGVIAPRTVSVSRDAVAGAGLTFPFLLRAPGFHTGMHFEMIAAPADVAPALARLPGKDLFAIEYADVRGADGNARKYRVMFVGGEMFPLHLAISPDWKVHYFSADMAAHQERRAEEERFLTDPAAVLGTRAMRALSGIAERLDLDYAGADFALDRDGSVVLFEANATMVVPVAGPDPRFAYRRDAIDRIERAVRSLLLQRAGRVTRLRSV